MKISEYRFELKKTLTEGCGKEQSEEIGELIDILLCHFLDITRSDLYLALDNAMPVGVAVEMENAVSRLAAGVPVQYIMGSCYFRGHEIKVGNGVFIPRSDTEVLVSAAEKALKKGGVFADICSGSGCISLALADARPDSRGWALELSRSAIRYCEDNLAPYPSVTVRRFDALDISDYTELEEANGGPVDLVVSNPPYIPTDDIQMLDTNVLAEPETALDGGPDGLRFYREIIKYLPIILAPDGAVCFEVGIGQSGDVSDMLSAMGFAVAVLKDLHGIERVVLGKRC